MAEVVISLSGGLNTDESVMNPPAENRGVSSYALGDYKYLLNFRSGSSIDENTGAAEYIASTLEISNYYTWNGSAWVSGTAPVGTNTAINQWEDKGKFYWAVHNSNGDDQILMYVKSERQIYELCKWTGFNFDLTKFVSMCKINKYLIITDKNSPPRILNVNTDISTVDTTQIFRLRQSLGANFSEYHISFAKWPPLAPPLVRRATSGTSQYIDKGIFQMAYRYVYVGGMKSTFSPASCFVTNEIDGSGIPFSIYIPGYIFDYETPASTSFQHSSIKFYQVVQYIELAYRQSTRDSWKLFKRHTVDAVDNVNFLFENNGPSARIPTQDIGLYFDSVPLKSGACEAIDNRPMFADNEDEFTAVTDFDVENVEVYSINPGVDSWNGPSTAFASLSGPNQTLLDRIQDINRFAFKERGIYKLGIVFQHFAGRENLATTLDKWTYTIPSYTPTVPSAVENYSALGFNIPASVDPPDWAVAYKIVRSNCLNIEYFIHGIVNEFKFLQNDENPLGDDLETPDTVKTLITDHFDGNQLMSVANKLFKRKFNLVDKVMAEIRKNKETTNLVDASRIYMDIGNWILTSKADAAATTDHPANNLFYEFQAGDRVRFWGSTTANFNIGDLVRFDEEIIEYTGRGIIVNKPDTLVTMKRRIDPGSNPSQAYQIEVYRPKEFNEDEDVIFYDMGEWYPITQPRTASRDFAKRDFRWTSAAAVTVSTVNGHTIYNKMPISNGDVWMVAKDFYFNFASPFVGYLTGAIWSQMTQDKKRAWDFWEKNNGRAYAAYTYLPIETDKPGQIRFGGKFLEDSLFVSINTFRDEWQHIYPSEYGRIRSMKNTANAQVESVGSILIVIGEEESWSVYVNRTTLEDLSGRTQVSISDKVLGSYNTLLGSHGTLNPDSVTARNGRVIWWNAKVGEWVRYSRDGLTEISEKGMKNWFKDLSDLLIDEYESTAPKVLSIFDNYHNCWVTYINHANLPGTFKGYSSYKCVTFAERNADKRWKEFLDLAPDVFASLDNEVYSIIGSKVHIHEAGADFGSVYGTKKDAYIEVVANPDVLENKVFTALALEASDLWSFESVKGDWRSNSGVRQETRMRTDDLQKKEWTFWTNIKKDKNTPNAASEQAGVINGENMRSKTLRILMKLDPSITYYNLFNYLVVRYLDSPVNPKK